MTSTLKLPLSPPELPNYLNLSEVSSQLVASETLDLSLSNSKDPQSKGISFEARLW